MVRAALVGAERVFTSDLTLVECARALVRAETLLELSVAEAARQRARLQAISARWSLSTIGASVIDRRVRSSARALGLSVLPAA